MPTRKRDKHRGSGSGSYIRSPLRNRAISSAGSEHYLDKVGVAGSNPALPTGFQGPRRFGCWDPVRQRLSQVATFCRYWVPYFGKNDHIRSTQRPEHPFGRGCRPWRAEVTFSINHVPRPNTLSQVLFRKKARPVSQLSDEDLVTELQRDMDADRFGILYDRYSAKVYQKCVGMTRNKELSQDLTHDIFLKAFVNLTKFDHRSRFGTWLYSVTYNYCLDHLRKEQKHRTTELDDDLKLEDGAEERYEAELLSMRAERLAPVLDALDPVDRGILLMKYQDELSVKDMMDVLGVGESAVKMRAMRARERALAKYHLLYPEEP